jgi:hypothetical protein
MSELRFERGAATTLRTMSIEQGAGIGGQEYLAQPTTVRAPMRGEIRHGLFDTGGPVQVEVDVSHGSGRR